MKISTLKQFVTVAKYRNFTKASEVLFISQPTISRRIQELEQELGVKLFMRHNRHLDLTEEGELFLKEAEKVINQVDAMAQMFIEKVKKDDSKMIHIGYQRDFNMFYMYETIEYLKQRFNQIDILVTRGTPIELKEGLKKDKFDLVFALKVFFDEIYNIKTVSVYRNHLQVAVPKNHKLSQAETVKFADLIGEDFIMLDRKQAPFIVDFVVTQCMKNGYSLNATYYVENSKEGLALVGAGKGITFIHSGMNYEGLCEKYNIKTIDIEEYDEVLEFGAIYKENNNNELIPYFLENIK